MQILSTINKELLKPNPSVAFRHHSHSIVNVLPPESDSTDQLMTENPDVTCRDIGGLDM